MSRVHIHEKVAEPRGSLVMKIYRRGILIETIEEHNIVVNGGRARLAQLIAGKSTDAVKYIGFGTGGTNPKISDTNLTNRALKQIDSSEVVDQDAIFHWTLETTEPAFDDPSKNGAMDIREFALFAADTVMLTHLVRARVTGKDVDMRIEGTYTLHF